jgi:hypothetical protein
MRRPAYAAYAVLCAACALGSSLSLFDAFAADTAPGPPVIRKASDVALPVDAETLDRQYRALSSMPSVEVEYSSLGPVRTVRGATGVELSRPTLDLAAGADASELLQKFKDALLATGSETLKVGVNELRPIGRTIRTDQFIGGIPVLYGNVSVVVDDSTGLVNMLNATFLPDRGLPRQPKISATDADALAEQKLVEFGIAKPGSVKTSTPTLAYIGTHPDSTRGHLVWTVPASYSVEGKGAADGVFWFDAIDGELVGRDALSKEAALRVYAANNVLIADANLPSGLQLVFTHAP